MIHRGRLGTTLGLVAGVLTTAFLACGPPLPSSTPLGMGPLAVAEQKARRVRGGAGGDSTTAASSGGTGGAGGASARQADAASAGSSQGGAPGTKTASAGGAGGDGGAGGAGGGKLAADEYVGLWIGEDTTQVRLEGMPQLPPQKDSSAKTRVEKIDDDRIRVVIVASNTGQDICDFEAELKENQAELVAGQTCQQGPNVTATVTSGSVKREGDKLVFDNQADLEMSLGPMTKTGKMEYRFEGTRQ